MLRKQWARIRISGVDTGGVSLNRFFTDLHVFTSLETEIESVRSTEIYYAYYSRDLRSAK